MASVRAVVLLALVCAASGARLGRSAKTCTLEGQGVSADITTSPTYSPAGGEWKFSGAGKVQVAHTACPASAGDGLPTPDETFTNGGASDTKDVTCSGACCISYCCGTGDCFSTLQVKNTTKAAATKATKAKASNKICLVSELYVAPSSGEGGSGGQGAYAEVTGAEGSCISTTNGVAIKFCGTGEVEAFSSSGCSSPIAGSPITHGTNMGPSDCTEITGVSVVSVKYSCTGGNR